MAQDFNHYESSDEQETEQRGHERAGSIGGGEGAARSEVDEGREVGGGVGAHPAAKQAEEAEIGEDRDMAQRFKVGDIVQLKSGGPRMTVDSITEPIAPRDRSKIWCAWFAGHKHERADFSPETLMLAPEEKSKE